MLAGRLSKTELLLLPDTPDGEPGGALGSLPCLALATSQDVVQTYPLTMDIMELPRAA